MRRASVQPLNASAIVLALVVGGIWSDVVQAGYYDRDAYGRQIYRFNDSPAQTQRYVQRRAPRAYQDNRIHYQSHYQPAQPRARIMPASYQSSTARYESRYQEPRYRSDLGSYMPRDYADERRSMRYEDVRPRMRYGAPAAERREPERRVRVAYDHDDRLQPSAPPRSAYTRSWDYVSDYYRPEPYWNPLYIGSLLGPGPRLPGFNSGCLGF